MSELDLGLAPARDPETKRAAFTERDVLDMLHARYSFVRPYTDTRRYAVAEHEEPGVAMAALISSVEPSDSIPLCNGHWNKWLAVFMPLHAHDARPPVPCGAHLIATTPKEDR